jgi:hypothetical protein
MRNGRALLLAICVLIALVIFLLFALFRRHNTITTVVSSNGFVGGSAKAGDTLVFRTYQGGDLGYTVSFTGSSPCKDGSKSLKVTPGQESSCLIQSSEGQQVSYFYQIIRNVSQHDAQPYTVIPCRLCYLNTGSVAGDADGNKIKTSTPPSDNVSVQIGCKVDNNAPGVDPQSASVLKDSVATIGWLWIDSDWKVVFTNGTPCADNTTKFSSDGLNGPSQCSIDPNASTSKTYSYDWSLTSCNGKPASGTNGNVVLVAPPPAQPNN